MVAIDSLTRKLKSNFEKKQKLRNKNNKPKDDGRNHKLGRFDKKYKD